METRYRSECLVGLFFQIVEEIGLFDIQACFPAPGQQYPVCVDPAGCQSVFREQFEPFTSSAAEVENRRAFRTDFLLLNKWEIDAESILDVGPGSTKSILEGNINAVQGVIPFIGDGEELRLVERRRETFTGLLDEN